MEKKIIAMEKKIIAMEKKIKLLLEISPGLLDCVMAIEHIGSHRWHPDTYQEKITEKKVEVVQMLIDIAKYGDRKDGLDNFWLPLYFYAKLSQQTLLEVSAYLITYDTLPFVNWNLESEKLEQALLSLEDNELKACLLCARYWFMCKLLNEEPQETYYLDLLAEIQKENQKLLQSNN